jgi:hypothetical protein
VVAWRLHSGALLRRQGSDCVSTRGEVRRAGDARRQSHFHEATEAEAKADARARCCCCGGGLHADCGRRWAVLSLTEKDAGLSPLVGMDCSQQGRALQRPADNTSDRASRHVLVWVIRSVARRPIPRAHSCTHWNLAPLQLRSRVRPSVRRWSAAARLHNLPLLSSQDAQS